MLKTIGAIPLFAPLKEEELIPLIRGQEIYLKNYRQGVTIYQQREKCKTFDVVLTGKLVAYSLSENGSSMTLFEFPQGHVLGANLLFTANGSYPFNIYCMADAQVLHVSRKAVEELLHNYEFTLNFMETLSQNSTRLNRKISINSRRSLRENLLEYLKQEAKNQGANPLTLPMSKKQLADHLGVQRPSLFRELKKLKDQGIIEVDNRKIRLL
ncbi:MAG: Crp/Fnr family transcriptional regulator [Tissierellia bacterium]|nr:Crp/Fnr family transcriptional regulator [Tissierellia bacterium]